jgi:hypothetical protein
MCDEFVMHLMMNFPICPVISGESGTAAKGHYFEN